MGWNGSSLTRLPHVSLMISAMTGIVLFREYNKSGTMDILYVVVYILALTELGGYGRDWG